MNDESRMINFASKLKDKRPKLNKILNIVWMDSEHEN